MHKAELGFMAGGVESSGKRMTKPQGVGVERNIALVCLEEGNHSSSKGTGGGGAVTHRESGNQASKGDPFLLWPRQPCQALGSFWIFHTLVQGQLSYLKGPGITSGAAVGLLSVVGE